MTQFEGHFPEEQSFLQTRLANKQEAYSASYIQCNTLGSPLLLLPMGALIAISCLRKHEGKRFPQDPLPVFPGEFLLIRPVGMGDTVIPTFPGLLGSNTSDSEKEGRWDFQAFRSCVSLALREQGEKGSLVAHSSSPPDNDASFF